MAIIDSYDQLILLDLLFFILLFAEVVAYVFIGVYFTENFLEIVSYEYNLSFKFPDLFYGLYLAFSLTDMIPYSVLKKKGENFEKLNDDSTLIEYLEKDLGEEKFKEYGDYEI